MLDIVSWVGQWCNVRELGPQGTPARFGVVDRDKYGLLDGFGDFGEVQHYMLEL